MSLTQEFNLATRHKNFDIKLFEKLKTQNESEILNLATPESRKVYNWNRQVASCFHRCREFARLKISSAGILYGRIEPEHHVEDMVVKWFSGRFPLFTIMLESSRGTFIVTKDKKFSIHDKSISVLLPRFEKMLPKSEILSELEDFNSDEYWEKYYRSQDIKERRNRRYFQANIPRKFHNWEGLKLEKERFEGNKKLSDY
jgi:probable DNA metabolism protein